MTRNICRKKQPTVFIMRNTNSFSSVLDPLETFALHRQGHYWRLHVEIWRVSVSWHISSDSIYCIHQISVYQREDGEKKCYVTSTKMQAASLGQTVAEAQCCHLSKLVKMRREEGTQASKQKIKEINEEENIPFYLSAFSIFK